MAVLNLAQSVELAVKAALVENNVPIYERNGRTLAIHDALVHLAKLWNVERIEHHARIELLVDERNAIQHRYGTVDDVSLDYHMETTFCVLKVILTQEFDTGLDAWIRDNVETEIWTKVRFVESPQPAPAAPTAAIISQRSPTLDFIDGFARYERRVRETLRPFLDEGQRFVGSTLDFMIKALSNAPNPNNDLIRSLPDVYRLRNRAIHGDELPAADEVNSALKRLDEALSALDNEVSPDTVARALQASEQRVRGTRLPAAPKGRAELGTDSPTDNGQLTEPHFDNQ